LTSPVFIDTAYLVALTNASDRHHDEARSLAEAWSEQRTSFVTTDAVMLEYANFFARSALRQLTAATAARLRKTAGWRIEPLAGSLMSRGETRYAAHGDKAWSLTDCISMEVMTDAAIRDVATTDAHFTQAGFRPLMASAKR
jgi:predicted nucleic acid-binding protein